MFKVRQRENGRKDNFNPIGVRETKGGAKKLAKSIYNSNLKKILVLKQN